MHILVNASFRAHGSLSSKPFRLHDLSMVWWPLPSWVVLDVLAALLEFKRLRLPRPEHLSDLPPNFDKVSPYLCNLGVSVRRQAGGWGKGSLAVGLACRSVSSCTWRHLRKQPLKYTDFA